MQRNFKPPVSEEDISPIKGARRRHLRAIREEKYGTTSKRKVRKLTGKSRKEYRREEAGHSD